VKVTTSIQVQYLQARLEPTHIYQLDFKVGFLALAANIRLGKKWPTVTNTLAYYDLKLIPAVKSFYSLGPSFTFEINTYNETDMATVETTNKWRRDVDSSDVSSNDV
jgi:hypothetical protein